MPLIQTITTASGTSAFVPTARQLTINGVTYDLSADRSWTVEVLDDIIVTAPLTYNASTNTLGIGQASTSTNGYLSSTDWSTFNSKLSNVFTSLGDIVYSNAAGAPIRRAGNTDAVLKFLSQTGDGFGSSAAPQWLEITSTTIGAVPTSRTITINDVALNLSADRSWSVGDYGTW